MQKEELDFPVTVNTVIPIDKKELATSDEIRKLTKRGSDTFIKVPYDKIAVRPGHNGRTATNPGFSQDSLEELARSIIAIGLQDPISVDVLKDGTALILKGERRWLAIGIIRSWISGGNLKEFTGIAAEKMDKIDFDLVEAFTTPKHYNENDRIIAMLVENIARENLTPMEEAEGYMRLKNNGMTAAQIAKSIPGLSPMQLSLRLKLAGLSPEEKVLIGEGKISPTAAVKLAGVVDNPEERIELIEDAAQGENGKLKINDLLERIADNEANENPGNLVDGDEANNPLRNGDLVDEIKSGADDDLSMKGTSPKHKPDAKINGDPAVKSIDQPDVDGDFDDELLKSGTKTAFDLTTRVIQELKDFRALMGFDIDPRFQEAFDSMAKKLYDVKVILKLKKKK